MQGNLLNIAFIWCSTYDGMPPISLCWEQRDPFFRVHRLLDELILIQIPHVCFYDIFSLSFFTYSLFLCKVLYVVGDVALLLCSIL